MTLPCRVKGILATSDTTWEDFEDLEKQKEAATKTDKKPEPEQPADFQVNQRGGPGLKR